MDSKSNLEQNSPLMDAQTKGNYMKVLDILTTPEDTSRATERMQFTQIMKDFYTCSKIMNKKLQKFE